ncbi:MAG: cytidylate kinase-like family protein [Nitrospirae bacterium]|nr:cytidylate kinase-like family protein [Nitrospirota bacterium]
MGVIAVGRELGSDGAEIARRLAQKLNYYFVNTEQILEDMEKEAGHEWANWVKEYDEHCPTLWERFDRSFMGFVALIEESIFDHARNDNVVILGRGGYWILREIPFVLRVRIVAPFDVRVERIMAREQVDKDMAVRMIRDSDKERSCYIKVVYNQDWSDPEAYDAVFDTDRLTSDEVIKMVVDIIPDKDKEATREAKEKLRHLYVASKVKARIAVNPYASVPTLEVFHDGTRVVVRGVVHSPKEHKLVENIARQTAAPTPVKCELQYR